MFFGHLAKVCITLCGRQKALNELSWPPGHRPRPWAEQTPRWLCARRLRINGQGGAGVDPQTKLSGVGLAMRKSTESRYRRPPRRASSPIMSRQDVFHCRTESLFAPGSVCVNRARAMSDGDAGERQEPEAGNHHGGCSAVPGHWLSCLQSFSPAPSMCARHGNSLSDRRRRSLLLVCMSQARAQPEAACRFERAGDVIIVSVGTTSRCQLPDTVVAIIVQDVRLMAVRWHSRESYKGRETHGL